MLTLVNGTQQAEPRYRNHYDRIWSQHLGIASAITSSIATELLSVAERPGRSRAWIIGEAQPARRKAVLAAVQARKDALSLRAYRKAQKETRRFMAEAAE